jgi:hypothetical protein
VYIRVIETSSRDESKPQYQIVAVYVDDLIIAASTKILIVKLEGIFHTIES